MDRITCMEAFVAVAREGTFTAAADRLGTTPQMVSKQVARLETELGVQLLARTTRSVSLTDTGTGCLPRCVALIEQLGELADSVQERHGALKGPIRLTAPTGYGSTRLTEALYRFMEDHQRVQIDLHLSDARVAIVEDGFDLAIRIGALEDSTLIARRLTDMPLVFVAAPSYLTRFGSPETPQDLIHHECLINRGLGDPETWRFTSEAEPLAVRVSGAFSANGPAAIARMAECGLGVARSPLYVVEAALAEGRLVRLFEGREVLRYGVNALYPPNRHLTARVRALIDHLADVLG
ncbi:MAG: LysR family transcriptional regulator [Pseudomonadota bacterium]